MNIIPLLFYLFATVAVVSGTLVILSANPVRSVLFLVLTFFAMAGVWMLLHAEFLALVLVLVYVGAVMTLFLFVVMMLNVDTVSFREGFVKYLPWAILIVLSVVGVVVMVMHSHGLSSMPLPPEEAANYSNTADLGSVLYTNYALPFVVSGVILLTAIIAAISLTHRVSTRRKSQIPSEQIAVKRNDRVRLVSMPAEKK